MSTSEAKTFKSVLSEGTGGSVKFIRPKELSAAGVTGVVAEGIYIGPVTNNFDATKSDYKIEATDGTLLILNSSGSLRNQLSKVEIGSYVRISYEGMQAMKKGRMAGKPAHSFLVEVAE